MVYAAAWTAAVSIRRFDVLMALAAIAGGATGAVLPATYAYAADLAPPNRRAQVIGGLVTGWSLAILVMTPLMSAVAQFLGWRWAFGLLSGMALVVAGMLRWVPGPGGAAEGAPGTEPGAPAAGVQDHSGAVRDAASPAPAGVASLARVLSDRPTMLVLGANLLDMGAFNAVLAFAAAELRRLGGLEASAAGGVLAVYGAGLAIASFAAGQNRSLGAPAHRDRDAARARGLAAGAAVARPLAVADGRGNPRVGDRAGRVLHGDHDARDRTDPGNRQGSSRALLGGSTYLGVSLYTLVSAWLYAEFGYWAVGVASAAGCAVAAVLLARLPRAPK